MTVQLPPNLYGPQGFFLARLPDGSHIVYQAILSVSPEALEPVSREVEELLESGIDVRLCAIHDPTTVGVGAPTHAPAPPPPGYEPPPPPPPSPPVKFLMAMMQVKPGKTSGDP